MRLCLTCNVPIETGSHCPEHRPDRRRGRRSLKGWSRVRRYVLERDGYLCQLRLEPCTGIATTVDHVIPKARGGPDIPSNLQAACAPCNGLKGARLLT